MLKKSLLFLFAAAMTAQVANAQLLKKATDALNKASNNSGTGSVTQEEAGAGIKEALSKGVANGIALLNKQDGFYKSELYKVLLPPDAQKVEKTLRGIGLGSMVDKAILQINRGAEEAVGQATPIFVGAIKQMSITDALKLVTGGNTSATDYFKVKTTDTLRSSFKPVIASSLEKTSATKYYGELVTKYNSLPTTLNKVNPNLDEYVTDMAVKALFDRIAKEEANIRANPAAQTSALLKKVFGKS